jgi:hypothetical protein
VRIRRRKPCFLWRRRLFGWYVRLLTTSPVCLGVSPHKLSAWRKTWYGGSTGTAHPRRQLGSRICAWTRGTCRLRIDSSTVRGRRDGGQTGARLWTIVRTTSRVRSSQIRPVQPLRPADTPSTRPRPDSLCGPIGGPRWLNLWMTVDSDASGLLASRDTNAFRGPCVTRRGP